MAIIKHVSSNATTYRSGRFPIVESGTSTNTSVSKVRGHIPRTVITPADGTQGGQIYPGGPSVAEYGVDLNNTLNTSPSYSSAPVPESTPPKDMPTPFSTMTLGA